MDAKNAIFIMTSNIGTELYKREPIGFRSPVEDSNLIREEVKAQLKKSFRPEFLNRLDEVILFQPLVPEDISRIAHNLLADLRKRLEEKEILFDVEEEALALICREGYDPMNGARPLARTIERLITKPLSEKIIAGEFAPGDKVLVAIRDGRIVFTKVEEDE